MSDPTNSPALRIGDREREAAVEQLRAAAGDGRITLDELETRVESALAARTADDIKVLVGDLPAPTGLAAVAAAPPQPARLAVSHGTIERLGAWRVPEEITTELRHGVCTLDLRTPSLPVNGVAIAVQARHSVIKILVAADAVVDLTNLGRHHSQASDKGARRVTSVSGPPIVFTGNLHHSVVKVLRPGRSWFMRLFGR